MFKNRLTRRECLAWAGGVGASLWLGGMAGSVLKGATGAATSEADGADGWIEDFEGPAGSNGDINGVRGWAAAMIGGATTQAAPPLAQVVQDVVHGGKQALLLKADRLQVQRALPTTADAVWIDLWLRGPVQLSLTSANGGIIALSSTSRGLFSASEYVPYRRISTDTKIDNQAWRRITFFVDRKSQRLDFYLDGKCTFRHLMPCTMGKEFEMPEVLALAGAGHVDDIKISTQRPQGLGDAMVWYPPRADKVKMRILQISDTHLEAKGSYDGQSVRICQDLGMLKPDVVIHTGDVCDHGDPEGLAKGKALFGALKLPAWFIPGNHEKEKDAFAAYEKIFGPSDHVEEHAGVRFILTNNADPADHMGDYTDEQVAWMSKVLEAKKMPTFLAGHVPLLKTEKAYFVRKNQDKVIALLKRHGVLAYMSGHLHRWGLSSVQDGFIHASAMPVSGAYVPPTLKLMGAMVWDLSDDELVMYDTPLYFPYDPKKALRIPRRG